jgi:hypothetical protein
MNSISYKSNDETKKPVFPTQNITIDLLLLTRIPNTKYMVSIYLHHVILILEKILTELDENPMSDEGHHDKLKKLDKKLNDYWFRERSNLSVSNKTLLWLSLCRLQNIFYNIRSDKSFGNVENLVTIHKLGIVFSRKNVMDLNFYEFWKSLLLLISKFSILPYSDELKLYCNYMKCKCAEYVGYIKNDSTMGDLKLITENVGEKSFQTNEYFWKETERIFYYCDFSFIRYSKFVIEDPVSFLDEDSDNSFPTDISKNVNIFMEWIETYTKGIYAQYIDRNIREQLFDVHLLRGDSEKYKLLNKMGEASAYNIIGKLRTAVLDKLTVKSNGNTIKFILDEEKKCYQKNWILNEEFVLLCKIVLTFYFDAKYPGCNFSKYFIITKEMDKKFYRDCKFPIIAKVFNEYGVFYKNTVRTFYRFADLFLYWIWLVCQEPLNGNIINTNYHITELYGFLFPDDKENVERLRTLNNKRYLFASMILSPDDYFKKDK